MAKEKVEGLIKRMGEVGKHELPRQDDNRFAYLIIIMQFAYMKKDIDQLHEEADVWLESMNRKRKDVLWDEEKKRHYVVIEMEMEDGDPGAHYDSKFYVPEEYEVVFF